MAKTSKKRKLCTVRVDTVTSVDGYMYFQIEPLIGVDRRPFRFGMRKARALLDAIENGGAAEFIDSLRNYISEAEERGVRRRR